MISRDELLERAVRNARPESNRWAHMTAKVRGDPSVQTFRWVIARLADPRAPARRFAVDVLFSLVLLELEYALAMRQAELDWTGTVLARLDSGALDWPAPLRADLPEKALHETTTETEKRP